MDELVLADIQALAASPDYGGRGFLQPSSAVLGLSAALFLSDLTLWQGAGYKLTDGEIDDIQAMIAQLESDLMQAGDVYPQDRCKVSSSVKLTIPTGVATYVDWDTEIYDPEDMHSLVFQTYRIDAVSEGLHLICGTLAFDPNGVGYRELELRQWRTGLSHWVIAESRQLGIDGTDVCTLQLSTQVEALAGDRFWLLAKQTSGGDLQTRLGDEYPFFAVVKL